MMHVLPPRIVFDARKREYIASGDAASDHDWIQALLRDGHEGSAVVDAELIGPRTLRFRTAVSQLATPGQCLACSALNPPNATFCRRCGAARGTVTQKAEQTPDWPWGRIVFALFAWGAIIAVLVTMLVAVSGCTAVTVEKPGEFTVSAVSILQRIDIGDLEAEQSGPTTRRVKLSKARMSPEVSAAIKALGEAVK